MTGVVAQPGLPPAAQPDARPAGAWDRPWNRLLAALEGGHARAVAALVALCLLCFLPGFTSLQPMDRDEPRFAQATKQMLETGDLVDIRFQNEARHKKPAGIHWMQAAAVSAGGALGVPEARTTIALYRLPSLLGAIAGVLLAYWAALAFLRRRDAWLAAAIVAASIVLAGEARLAKTDAVLLACTTAVMGGLARVYLNRGAATALPPLTLALFWGGFSLGVLVKGPMVLLFAGLTALVLSVRERGAGWLKPLRPWLGLGVTLAVVLPWFLAIAVKSGGAYYTAAVGDDLLGKVGQGQQKHGGPPGYYTLAFFLSFWPAAALAALAAPYLWRHRREDAVAFLLAWVVPAWALFEAITTKLPHYVLPLYPAVAVATLVAVSRGGVNPASAVSRGVALLMPLVPALLGIGLAAGAWTLDRTIPWAALALIALSTAIAVLGWRLFARGDARAALLAGVAASIALSLGALGPGQAALRSLKVSPRLAEAAQGLACPDRQVGTLGYREPSLVFLAGTALRMFETGPEAAAWLAGQRCAMLFVEARFEPAFLAAAEAGAGAPRLWTRVAGFNINGGRKVDLGAYAVGP